MFKTSGRLRARRDVSSTSRQSNGRGFVFAAFIKSVSASRPAMVAADLASSQRTNSSTTDHPCLSAKSLQRAKLVFN